MHFVKKNILFQNAALKKQKFLEDENVSQAFQMESMQAKFKSRENELELSLQVHIILLCSIF